jgi:hypothetical protein
MSKMPNSLERREDPEEVGASHGEVRYGWRVTRNGMILAVVALVAVYLVFV